VVAGVAFLLPPSEPLTTSQVLQPPSRIALAATEKRQDARRPNHCPYGFASASVPVLLPVSCRYWCLWRPRMLMLSVIR